jgi:hypothetical protein
LTRQKSIGIDSSDKNDCRLPSRLIGGIFVDKYFESEASSFYSIAGIAALAVNL